MKAVQCSVAAAFVGLVADHGPLVPVVVGADLVGVSPQAVWDRVHRGTLPVVMVRGRAFVPLVKLSSAQGGVGRASLGPDA